MFWFVMPLIVGFTSNAASAFTALHSEKFGKSKGSVFTFILRNITGIPLWAAGFVIAMLQYLHKAGSPFLPILVPETIIKAWLFNKPEPGISFGSVLQIM